MILVDTSVWIDHLRSGDPNLSENLRVGAVMCHPFVVGELACGSLSNRDEILSLLGALPAVTVAEHREALRLIDVHKLAGTGLGWIDVHLLASARLSQCRIWSRDANLMNAARKLDVAFESDMR